MDIEQMYLVILHTVTKIFVNCLKILLQYQVIVLERSLLFCYIRAWTLAYKVGTGE
jgi:hypothetical protein